CYTCSGQPSSCAPTAPGVSCPSAGSCSVGTCNGAGACTQSAAPNATPCNDGLFCNGADTCSGGTCSAHAGNPCAGGPQCANVCNEFAHSCSVPDGTLCVGSDP